MADAVASPASSTIATADPGPLGLAGFAATTLVLSIVTAGLVDAKVGAAVLPLALFYGGLGQLLAGMWEFRGGNTFGATAFSTYGAFWLAYAFFGWFFADKIPANDQGVAAGLFNLVFTIVTAYLTVAALRLTGALVTVLALLTVTFLLLTIGNLASSDGIVHIGGWVGIVTALAAFYTSFAIVTNVTWRRNVLPLFPLGTRAPAV